MKRGFLLGGLAICVFVVVSALMLRFMPSPLKESDYMVIGSVATLLALGAVLGARLAPGPAPVPASSGASRTAPSRRPRA